MVSRRVLGCRLDDLYVKDRPDRFQVHSGPGRHLIGYKSDRAAFERAAIVAALLCRNGFAWSDQTIPEPHMLPRDVAHVDAGQQAEMNTPRSLATRF